jgi:hypothetical protein
VDRQFYLDLARGQVSGCPSVQILSCTSSSNPKPSSGTRPGPREGSGGGRPALPDALGLGAHGPALTR